MKTFKYKAKKNLQETVEGVLVAESKDEVIDQINSMGFLPVEINEERSSDVKESNKRISLFLKKISSRERAIFYGQLAKLVKSGVPILRTLTIIRDQTGNEYFKEVLNGIQRGVKEGSSLSVSLSNYPHVFPSFDIAMIQTGESVGKLGDSMARLVSYLEERDRLRAKASAAIAYPIFIIIMGCITVFVMLVFVIPKFSQFFSDLGQQLPLSTRILISLSQKIKKVWAWIALVLIGIIAYLRRASKTKAEKRGLDLFLLSIPKVGELVTKYEIARLSRALELLLKNGMQVLHALKIAIPVVSNEVIKDDLEVCYKKLEQGSFFSDGLKQSKFFPPFVYYMVSVGEESGRLDEALGEIAEWYEKDTAQSIQVATNLIEPLIILMVGFVLGLIIIAVLMPVFSINSFAQ